MTYPKDNFVKVSVTLATAVAAGGTFTVGYPAGIEGGMFRGNTGGHKIVALGGTYKALSADSANPDAAYRRAARFG